MTIQKGQILTGETDATYEIIEPVDKRGSMGVVYKASEVGAQHHFVAVKVIHTNVSKQAEFARRFEADMAILTRIEAKHIANVLDTGEYEGKKFVVTEFVPGQTLDLLMKQPLPIVKTLRIVRQVAQGLQEAVATGKIVAHRDLKPQNLMVTPDDRVKILDFGLAKGMTARGATQVAIGTQYYMAPEQFSPTEEIDVRADIYALGCITYEMLVGYPPYRGTFQEIAQGHMLRPVPNIDREGVSPEVQTLVRDCMAKSPDQRPSPVEVIAWIDKIIPPLPTPSLLPKSRVTPISEEDGPEETPPDATMASIPRKMVEAIKKPSPQADRDPKATILGLDREALEAAIRPSAPADRPKARLVGQQGPQLVVGTTFPIAGDNVVLGRSMEANIPLKDGRVSRQHARISWQGDSFVLEDLDSANGTFLNQARVTHPQRLKPGDNIRIGHSVFVFEEVGAKEMEPSPPPRFVASLPTPSLPPPPPKPKPPFQLAPLPTSRWEGITEQFRDIPLWVMGAILLLLISCAAFIFWGPFSSSGLISASTPTPTETPTSTYTPLPTPTDTPLPAPTGTPSPTPTGTPAPTDTPLPTPTDTLTPEPSDTPTSTPTIAASSPLGPRFQSVTIAYVQSGNTLNLITSDPSKPEGEFVKPLFSDYAAAPAWSPDGTQIAFIGLGGISSLGGLYAADVGIWLVDQWGGDPRQLVKISDAKSLSWSPDGARIAFHTDPPGLNNPEIHIVDARDGNQLGLLPGRQPAWMNTELLAFNRSGIGGQFGIWLANIYDGSIEQLTNVDGDSFPAVSPDGRYLAFTSTNRHNNSEIYLLDLTGSNDEPQLLTNRPSTELLPVFGPDGREIYFLSDAEGGWRIKAINLNGGNERLVWKGIGPIGEESLSRPTVR